MQQGFSRIKLFFGIAFAAIVFSAVYSHLSPIERIKEKKDEQNKKYAQKLLSAIDYFFESKERLPWADDLGSQNSRAGISFVGIGDPAVGICQDNACSGSGELAALVPGLFPPPDKDARMHVGKGQEADDPSYVCFVPQAAVNRRKTGELNKLNMEQPNAFYRGGLGACNDNVNWTDSVCYYCVK